MDEDQRSQLNDDDHSSEYYSRKSQYSHSVYSLNLSPSSKKNKGVGFLDSVRDLFGNRRNNKNSMPSSPVKVSDITIDETASILSTNSTGLHLINGKTDIDLDMPPAEEVDRLFRKIMAERMDNKTTTTLNLPDLPLHNKWSIVKTAIQAEHCQEATIFAPNQQQQQESVDTTIGKMKANDSFWMDRDLLRSLRMSLAMQTIGWVKEFADKRGLGFILRGLRAHQKSIQPKRLDQSTRVYHLDCQYELLRCFRAFTNNKFGMQFVMANAIEVLNILVPYYALSQHRQSRHLVFQFLAVYGHLKGSRHLIELLSQHPQIESSPEVPLPLEGLLTLLSNDLSDVNYMLSQPGGLVDEDIVSYLTDTFVLINCLIVRSSEEEESDSGETKKSLEQSVRHLEQRMKIRSLLYRGPLQSLIELAKEQIKDHTLVRQCDLFLREAEQDVLEISGIQETQKRYLAGMSTSELVNMLENGDQGCGQALRMLIMDLVCAPGQACRDRYLGLLNAFMSQLVIWTAGSAKVAIIPEFTTTYSGLNYVELLQAASGSERASCLERTLTSFKGDMMRQEMAWRQERQQLEQRLEDAELALAQTKKLQEAHVAQLEGKMDELTITLEKERHVAVEFKNDVKQTPLLTLPPVDDDAIIKDTPVPFQQIESVSKNTVSIPKTCPPPPPPVIKPPPLPASKSPTQPGASKKRFRQLQWDRIPDAEVRGTIWETLDKDLWTDRFELTLIDSLFQLKDSNGTSTPASTNSQSMALVTQFNTAPTLPNPTEVTFVESKRALNMSIVLGSAKLLGIDALKRALLNADYSVVTETLINQLLKYTPTPEELLEADRCKAEQIPLDKMRKAEQFIVHVTSSISGYERLLQAYRFKFTFKEWFEGTMHELDLVDEVCTRLEKSPLLKEVLESVLFIGNYLNQGTIKGGALGFRLRSLCKLIDTRSTTNGTTSVTALPTNLLQCLVTGAWTNLTQPINDLLADVDRVARFSFPSHLDACRGKESELTVLDSWCKGYKPAAIGSEDRVSLIFGPFFTNCHERLIFIKEKLTKVQEQSNELHRFLASPVPPLQQGTHATPGDQSLDRDQVDLATASVYTILAVWRQDLDRARAEIEVQKRMIAESNASSRRGSVSAKTRVNKQILEQMLDAGTGNAYALPSKIKGDQLMDSMISELRAAH